MHKLCDISRAVYYMRNTINIAEVTITINGFVDPLLTRLIL